MNNTYVLLSSIFLVIILYTYVYDPKERYCTMCGK